MLKVNQADPHGKYEFRSRIKFVMKNDELNQKISELKDATDSLTKLRELSTLLTQHNPHSEQKTAAKYAIFLQRVRQYASVLHLAISQRLVSGCHHEHESRLYLEHRAAVLQKERISVDFRLILGSPSVPTSGDRLPTEIQVAALDDDISE